MQTRAMRFADGMFQRWRCLATTVVLLATCLSRERFVWDFLLYFLCGLVSGMIHLALSTCEQTSQVHVFHHQRPSSAVF